MTQREEFELEWARIVAKSLSTPKEWSMAKDYGLAAWLASAARYEPLVEAARAYRKAVDAFVAKDDDENWITFCVARDALDAALGDGQ